MNRAAMFTFKDQDDYKAFHTYNDNAPYSTGITILVYKLLAKNIHQVNKINSHILIFHFHFKDKKKLCII